MAKGVNPGKDWCEMSKIVAHAIDSDVNAALFGCFCLFVFNVPVNNFSVMSGRIQRFLGITSTFGE